MISHSILTRGTTSKGLLKQIDSYYQDSKDDYYAKDNQPSQWQGKLAIQLGLTGSVEKEQFINLMAGRSPNENNQQLRQDKYNNKHVETRLGIDLTFNAPKSISLESLVNGKVEVLQAHEKAVTKTLELIEQKAIARSKKDGITNFEYTGNLAIAKFRHETNRNLDPHLHTHAVIINLTQRADGEYRALVNDEIIQGTKKFTQIYQSYLAKELKELGYDLRITRDGFELAHISDKQIQAFSSRSQQIEQELQQKGLTRATATTQQKQEATLNTRQRKKEHNIIETRHEWRNRADELNIFPLNIQNTIKPKQQQTLTTFDTVFNQSSVTKQEYLIDDLREYRANSREYSYITSGTREPFFWRAESTGIRTPTAIYSSASSASRDSQKIQRTRNYEEKVSLFRDSEQNFSEFTTTRRTYFDYNLRTMPSITLANRNTRNTMLLPVDQEVQLFKQESEYNDRLRGRRSGSQYDESRGIETDNENLDSILNYSVENPIQDWKSRLITIEQMNETAQEVLYIDNLSKLKKFTVEHLTDKDHIFTLSKLKDTLLEKGLGMVDYDNLDSLVEEMINDELILKTQAKYQYKGKLYTEDTLKLQFNLSDLNQNDFETFIEKKGIKLTDEIYTTQYALNIDNDMIMMLKKSQNKSSLLTLSEIEVDDKLNSTTMNNEQKQSAKLILTTQDLVVGIQGYAGTGKSFMISQTKSILEEQGKQLHIFAPYTSQVKNLQADGLEANTLARLLVSKQLQEELNQDSVVIVDEAGVISSAQMHKLLKLRDDLNFKLVLLGDKAQTKAVEAGTPFELLQNKGMKIATMQNIQRQKNEELKQAVVSSVQGNFDLSVNSLSGLHEINKKSDRHKAIVTQYLGLNEQEREQTLIVSGTNNDRANISDMIREQLELKGNGITLDKLTQKDLTKAEKKLITSYEIDDYIIFSRNSKKDNIEKSTPYQIIEIDYSAQNLILTDGQKNFKIELKDKDCQVYKLEQIEISKGDKIRVNKTNQDIGLVAGDIFEIKNINYETNQAYAEDKQGRTYMFDRNSLHHIDYAYASTIHSAQGLTYDHVICDFNTKSRTLSQETYYVAISRARQSASVYVDSVNSLPDKIAETATKHNAIDLISHSHSVKKDLKENLVMTTHQLSKEQQKLLDMIQDFEDTGKAVVTYHNSNEKMDIEVITSDNKELHIEFVNQEVFVNSKKIEEMKELDDLFADKVTIYHVGYDSHNELKNNDFVTLSKDEAFKALIDFEKQLNLISEETGRFYTLDSVNIRINQYNVNPENIYKCDLDDNDKNLSQRNGSESIQSFYYSADEKTLSNDKSTLEVITTYKDFILESNTNYLKEQKIIDDQRAEFSESLSFEQTQIMNYIENNYRNSSLYSYQQSIDNDKITFTIEHKLNFDENHVTGTDIEKVINGSPLGLDNYKLDIVLYKNNKSMINDTQICNIDEFKNYITNYEIIINERNNIEHKQDIADDFDDLPF